MQVNTGATQNRTQENLLWALEQDQQQFLHYLDSLSKNAESRISSILGLRPTSPARDSDEQGGLQTPKLSDNVGVHGVLSVDVAVRDEEPLSGDVDHNSDTVSTSGDTVRFITEDMESLTTGEHDN